MGSAFVFALISTAVASAAALGFVALLIWWFEFVLPRAERMNNFMGLIFAMMPFLVLLFAFFFFVGYPSSGLP